MIVRTGVDIIEIDRFESQSLALRNRFFQRVFTIRELSLIHNSFASAAGKFAAKEAVAKTLGCGIGEVHWQDIEILHLPTGQPVVKLHGHAKIVADQLGLNTWSVSISHDRDTAVAIAVASGA